MKIYQFTERKKADVLPDGRIRIYFDEREGVETITHEEEDAENDEHPVYGYQVAECDKLEKGAIVNAIVRTAYSQSDVEAIFRHKLAGEDDEFDKFNEFAEAAKVRAAEILEG